MDDFRQMLKRKKEEKEEDLEFALIDRRRAAARGAVKNQDLSIFFNFLIRAAPWCRGVLVSVTVHGEKGPSVQFPAYAGV